MAENKIWKKWQDITFPGSFSNLNYFYKGLQEKGEKKKKRVIQEALRKRTKFQVSRRLPKTFLRRRDVSYYFSAKWEADLVHFAVKGVFKFFLLVIDVFSKKIFVEPLINKSAPGVLSALQKIINNLEKPYSPPRILETDSGKEFANIKTKKYTKKLGIRLLFASGGLKARNAERAIRSFKKVLKSYLSTNPPTNWGINLQRVARSLNLRYQRGIGTSPDGAILHWREIQRRNIKETPLKPFDQFLREQGEIAAGRGAKVIDGRVFYEGGKVYIPRPSSRGSLKKESENPFSYKPFVIRKIWNEASPTTFQVQDLNGTNLKRRFYAQELKQVPILNSKRLQNQLPISKLLASKIVNKQKMYLVRYQDHDSQSDEWLPAEEVEKRHFEWNSRH